MPTDTQNDILVVGAERPQADALPADPAISILTRLKRGNVALDKLRVALERDEARDRLACPTR